MNSFSLQSILYNYSHYTRINERHQPVGQLEDKPGILYNNFLKQVTLLCGRVLTNRHCS